MPSVGPSALSLAAKEVPQLLADIALEDRVNRGLIRKPSELFRPNLEATADLMRSLPRIFIFEVQWDRVANVLDRETNRRTWSRVVQRMKDKQRPKELGDRGREVGE
jgi:hypothetical protein